MRCYICGGSDDFAIRDYFGNLYAVACIDHVSECFVMAEARFPGEGWREIDRREWRLRNA